LLLETNYNFGTSRRDKASPRRISQEKLSPEPAQRIKIDKYQRLIQTSTY